MQFLPSRQVHNAVLIQQPQYDRLLHIRTLTLELIQSNIPDDGITVLKPNQKIKKSQSLLGFKQIQSHLQTYNKKNMLESTLQFQTNNHHANIEPPNFRVLRRSVSGYITTNQKFNKRTEAMRGVYHRLFDVKPQNTSTNTLNALKIPNFYKTVIASHKKVLTLSRK